MDTSLFINTPTIIKRPSPRIAIHPGNEEMIGITANMTSHIFKVSKKTVISCKYDGEICVWA